MDSILHGSNPHRCASEWEASLRRYINSVLYHFEDFYYGVSKKVYAFAKYKCIQNIPVKHLLTMSWSERVNIFLNDTFLWIKTTVCVVYNFSCEAEKVTDSAASQRFKWTSQQAQRPQTEVVRFNSECGTCWLSQQTNSNNDRYTIETHWETAKSEVFTYFCSRDHKGTDHVSKLCRCIISLRW